MCVQHTCTSRPRPSVPRFNCISSGPPAAPAFLTNHVPRTICKLRTLLEAALAPDCPRTSCCFLRAMSFSASRPLFPPARPRTPCAARCPQSADSVSFRGTVSGQGSLTPPPALAPLLSPSLPQPLSDHWGTCTALLSCVWGSRALRRKRVGRSCSRTKPGSCLRNRWATGHVQSGRSLPSPDQLQDCGSAAGST